MFDENDEERKKREEEAKNIISSLNSQNSNESSINFVNYSNDNNYKINVNNEEEQSYINKINEANSIINSINSREEGSIPEPTEEQREESRRNAQELLNLMDNNTQNIQGKQQVANTSIEEVQVDRTSLSNRNNKNAAVDIIMNKKPAYETKQTNQNNEQMQPSSNDNAEANENTNIFTSIKNIFENLLLGGASGVKQVLKYIETSNEQNFSNYKQLREKQYKTSPNTAIGKVTNQETNLIKKGLQDSIDQDTLKAQENINNTTGTITRKLAELAPSIGQMTVGWGASAINPMLGISYFMTSAGGSYIDDAKDRGMNDEQAFTYGTIMGAMEGATEEIGISKLMKGGKALSKGIVKEALKSYGLNAADNFIQEAIIEPISEATATIVGGKETADWNDITGRMLQAGFDGALSALIMDGASAGINSSIRVVDKIRNNKNISQTDIKKAIQDINDNENINVEDTIKSEINYQVQENSNTDSYMLTRYNNQNDNIELYDVKGEHININNNELNINPAVVKIEGFYNVIDANSGLELYTTVNTNKQDTINEFKEKINNLDQAGIQNVNNQVAQTKIAITNKFQEIENNPQAIQDFQLKNQNISDTNRSIISTQNNTQEISNPKVRDLRTAISQIQNSSYYNGNRANEIMKTVSDNFDNVTYTPREKSSILTIKNDKGHTMYSKEIRNNIGYSGKSIKNILSNVYNYVMNNENTNLNSTQTASEQNTDNFSSNMINYAVQDIKKVTEPFSNKESYTRDEMAEVWNNEISNNNYDAYYDNNGNIERYIAIEEEGNNIVVNQYDNNDNVVRSELIPSENGKYTAKDIQNTINKVASLYEEDRSIKRQQDVEGNKAMIMKKNTNSKNIMNNYDNKTASLIRKSKRDIIIENARQLNNLIDEALNSQSNKALHLGKLNETVINELKTKIKNLPKNKGDFLGKNTYDLIINQSEIRHLTDSKNNLTKKDIKKFIKLLPDLIINNDYVSYTKNTNGEGLRFKKLMSDGTYVSFVIISNKKGTMKAKTIYMEKGDYENKKRSISPPNDVNKTPDNTSKTSRAFASIINNSIPQNNTSVKNTVTNKSMQNNKNNSSNNSDDVRTLRKNTDNIQDDIENFSNQVDAVLDNTFPKNSMLTLLKETPKPLQDIGLPNLSITMTQRHLDTILNERGKDKNANYHNLGIDTVKQLPEAINTPLDIVKSNTRDDSIVLTTYLADSQDRTIVASVKINGKGTINDIRIDTNVMTSAYGKDNYEKFMERNIKNDNLLYDIDRGVIKKVTGARFQLPGSSNSTTKTNGSISTNIIPSTSEIVKNDKNVSTKQSMQNNKNNAQDQKKIQKELHNRIQNALLSKNTKKNTYLGQVSEKVAKKVQKLLGIDITGRKYILPDYNIRHIINQHGNPELERNKNQIAVTRKDIEKIPEILNTYDAIEKGSINTNSMTSSYNESIRYIKKYKNNITYVVEVIPKTGKTLEIKTMWKKPITLTNSKNTPSSTSKTRGNKVKSTLKNEPVGLSYGNNTLPYTSETKSNLGSNNSIPQNSQNVKNNDLRAMKNNTIDNLMQDVISKEKDSFKSNIKIDTDIVDKSTPISLNYKKVGQSTLSNIAKKLFNNIHKRVLNHNSEKIYVTNSDINESIAQTLKNPNQKAMLKDNLAVFSQLDKIIENAIEIKSSNTEITDNKARTQYKDYKYYYTQTYIDGEQTWVQFDTRVQKGTTGKDERHFRLERIYKINEASSNGGTGNKPITHFSNELTSNTSIPQNSQNVKNDSIRSMKKSSSNNNQTTSNQDIRFAKKTAKPVNEVLEPGQRNAERDSNYIEQEIQKIEKTGNWDSSIPVTKMTDIRKTIENYLGLGVQKGHFRQQAYGIYKSNRDVIRTKELKDIDTILHETGHALDLGNRIKINKETISDELLKAVDNYGGYEAETIEVQLEEGFAEVIREYAIVPEQARIDYPQTVTVLEGIRQENQDFDNFIRKVQEQSYNYIHQNPRNRGGLSNMSIGERTDQTKWTPSKIKQEVMRNIYDKDWVIKSAVNEMQKVNGKATTDLKASENAYYLTRLASGIGDKVTSILANGYIDENGNRLFSGLNQLGEILENNVERFNDLRAYLVAQRDLEYKANGLKTGIRTNDSKAIIEQFKNDTQIQEASKIIYDTLDGVLQYAVNNKLITAENAQNLRKSNVFYVPMQRVIGTNGNTVGKRGAVADIIKSRTGSELDIKDVLENIITNSANIIQQVENNKIINALYTQGENAGLTGSVYDEIDPPIKKIGVARLDVWQNELKNQGVDIEKIDFDKTMDIFVPNNNIDERNQIVSFIDNKGQRRYLQFNDKILFNSLMNMDKNFMSKILNITSKLNMPLRYGATMANIGFAIPNMISDTAQAAIFSEAGFIPVVDNIIGVMDILSIQNKTTREFFDKVIPGYADKINTLYAIYEQTGATSSTRMSQYRETTQNLMKDVYGTKNSEILGIKEKYKPLKRLLDVLTYIPEISEQSTRFRVFEKNIEYYRKNGMSETDARIQAALQSRDATQDFGRTGYITKEINQLIPFSAARVGSAYTFAEKVKANPKRVASRMAVLMVMSMAIKAIGYDDKEIEELNQTKKDDNFVLKIGDQIVTIKKPQGILRSLINLGEYVQDLFTGHIEEGKEGERLAEWLKKTLTDNLPADHPGGYVPNIANPIIENWANKDFYYNTEIVKSYDEENLPEYQQYYEYNSQMAIWLGKVFNYSPAKIDNLISGYFAGLGTSVTNVIDWIAGKIGISAEEAEMGAEDNAVAKRFIVNVNNNSVSIDEVYSLKTELTKKKNGGTITTEETQQLEAVTNATSNMAKLNKQIKEIKKDLTMSGKEKAEQIKVLQKQKVDIARQALGKELLYSENETNIESTTFYPSQNTLKQNGYTLNLTSDMKKEYEELAYNKYKEYENQGIYSEEKLEKIREKCKNYAKSQLLKKYKNDLIK